MPWFVTAYIILALIAVIFAALGHSKKHEGLQMIGVGISLAAGLILGFGAAGSDTSSGHYTYYINGVRAGSGVMVFFQGFALAIVFGALPNLLGMAIGSLPGYLKSQNRNGGFSLIGKIACVFCLVEGGLGSIIAIITAIVKKSAAAAAGGLIVSGTLLLVGAYLLGRWKNK
ncbi:MAG: hypothetical protein IJM15_00430 [Erysipelotrichaceae bacterium]|nr:hypothetical protein [Erysipelotrichaceae bacterium]